MGTVKINCILKMILSCSAPTDDTVNYGDM